MSIARYGIAVLFVTFLTIGCNRGPSPVQVQGVVLWEGQPLARATVIFVPQDSGGRDANGFTDAEGVFHLSTLRPKDGAYPGLYKVVIQYEEEGEGTGATTPEEAQKAAGKTKNPKKTPFTLPPIYGRPDKTVLQQKVPPEGPVKFNLVSSKD